MASLGQLTAGIAHEIKNPLNFVNNFAEINERLAGELREAIAGAEDLDSLIDDIERNARAINKHGKRADGIVHAMMQHASGGIGEREHTDLNALASEFIDLAYHGKRAQSPELTVDIYRDFSPDLYTCEVIPQEIARVLLNLLSNAFDAMLVKVATAGEDYQPTLTVTTFNSNATGEEKQIVLTVEDNGPGILKEIQEKIFEPFFTTKPAGLGTGLGLSLSYDIITHGHGGVLEVESVEGQSSKFRISLPVKIMPVIKKEMP